MHYLKLSSLSLFLFLVSCSAPYKNLQQDNSITSSALKYKPEFNKELFRCVVNGRVVFKKFHLSGLLFFKHMDDSTTRVVFQNEMGFTFFDFEWDKNDVFKVNKIIPQLDKVALIKTLEKDMNLLLMKNLDRSTEKKFVDNDETYYRFDLEKGVAYYITQNDKLVRIENAGKSKVITIKLTGKEKNAEFPTKVFFNHHKAHFTIELDKIDTHAD